MAFCPRLRDTVWRLFSLSRRETDNLHASKSDTLGGPRREAGPGSFPFPPGQPFCPYSSSITECPSRALGNNRKSQFRLQSPLLPSHNSEKMNAIILHLGSVPLNVKVSPSSSQAQTG